jgi:hypothetical protein
VIKPSSSSVFFILALGLLGSAGGRTAQAAESGSGCEPVRKAIEEMNTSPRFHWKMSATTPNRKRPSRHEEIVIGDIVYMTPPGPGKWMRLKMNAADRAAFSSREMEQSPPVECRLEQIEEVEGVEVQRYAYRQNLTPPGGGTAGSGETVSTSRLWVGSRDGLPRRIESLTEDVSVLVTVEYDNVEPPYQ